MYLSLDDLLAASTRSIERPLGKLKKTHQKTAFLGFFLAILSHAGWEPVTEMLICLPALIRNC